MAWHNLSSRYKALFYIDATSDMNNYVPQNANIPKSSILFEDVKIYKTMRIPKVNLKLKVPITIQNESTWILVTKVYGDFGALASGNTGTNNWGFEFRRVYDTTSSRQGWNDAGSKLLERLTTPIALANIHHVVVKNNRIAQEYSKFDSYAGQYVNSDVYSTTGFGNLAELGYIGYVGTNWEPDVDILGFACFDKVLTDLEIAEVLDAIYKESEIKISQGFNNKSIDTYSNFKIKNTFQILDYYKPIQFFKESLRRDLVFVDTNLNQDRYRKSVLYSELKDISDQILEEGLPVRCKAFLYERETGTLLKTTISDINGYFTFYNLDSNLEYIITANDNKYQYSSVIKNYNN